MNARTMNGIPLTERHAKSRVAICRTKSAVTLAEAAEIIALNDDISALREDSEMLPVSVALLASFWDVSPEYAVKVVLEADACIRKEKGQPV